MAPPIPIALVEPNRGFAEAIQRDLLPEFDAEYGWPRGDLFGIGSNSRVSREDRKAPRAVVLGATIDERNAPPIADILGHMPPEGKSIPVVKMTDGVLELRNQLNELVENGRIGVE
ncbi:hypothetical protein B0I37DRAFT_353931 [Chaetomium sp. MPI-CAGE-AT-0009]|nr:hypothetical protein B0I37DRAFT_353931 [Chaetomium sp. MPI-CAGE-AT-0009]